MTIATEQSPYNPPFMYRNPHVQIIHSALFRRVPCPNYVRERILTSDKDFLDLDWSRVGSKRLGIITHGLEGSSRARYIRGMVRMLNQNGWDALAWNMRGCSGEDNWLPRSYHSGSSDDLNEVFSHALFKKSYDRIVLLGFSLGGNITLKLLGEQSDKLSALVSAAVAFSVPLDLRASALKLSKMRNRFYLEYFLRSLRRKTSRKAARFTDTINIEGISRVRSFREFDDRYTAPLNGFKDAEEYWAACSSKKFLTQIAVPTLIINADDDPFLTPECLSVGDASTNPLIHLERTRHGGHVAFLNGSKEHLPSWAEARALRFIDDPTNPAR